MDPLVERDTDALARLSASTMLLLDRDGTVLHSGSAAETFLAATKALSIRNGVLTARRKTEDKALRDALAALTPAAPAAVICLRTRESHPVAVIDLRLLPGGGIAWRMTDLLARSLPSASRLRAVLGLTPAEARVAAALLAGHSLGAIARDHGVEPETVRTQAKRIRAKTGTRTQNQLLALLLALGPGL